MAFMLIAACQGLPANSNQTTGPVDPYDYNFCGGKPVYPVIGITFSTYCGPRNQLALGRTGTLSWLFPPHGEGEAKQGRRTLTEKELKHLSLLAEAVQLSGRGRPEPGAVIYNLGFDFPGRQIHQRYAVLSAADTPSNQLYHSMLRMAADKPLLPDCGAEMPFFDPIQIPGERRPLTLTESWKFQERTDGAK
ncbi:MAG: hypothetical protein OEV31_03970 [Gammaproteobacteria bacterium]|nr:hypothetical protein [Gammaproteobacteria bacterium]